MNSGKGLSGRRSWRFHPLEFGISGGEDASAPELVSRLIPLLGPGTGVVDGHTADPDEAAWTTLGCPSVLVVDPPPELMVPRLLLLGPHSPRTPVQAVSEPPPVAVAGPVFPPELPWGVPWFSLGDVEAIAGFIGGYWDSRTASRPLAGLVLTGGRGPLAGRDRVGQVFELLARFCSQTWVSCPRDQTETLGGAGWPLIHDRYLDRGPLGSLLSALDFRPDAAWLVAACDQPSLDEAVLSDLVDRRDPLRYATAFRGSDGLPEPLPAIYEPKSRLGLLRTWALGYPGPRKLLSDPGSLVLDP